MLRDFPTVHHWAGDGITGYVVTPPVLPQTGYEPSPWSGLYISADGSLAAAAE